LIGRGPKKKEKKFNYAERKKKRRPPQGWLVLPVKRRGEERKNPLSLIKNPSKKRKGNGDNERTRKESFTFRYMGRREEYDSARDGLSVREKGKEKFLKFVPERGRGGEENGCKEKGRRGRSDGDQFLPSLEGKKRFGWSEGERELTKKKKGKKNRKNHQGPFSISNRSGNNATRKKKTHEEKRGGGEGEKRKVSPTRGPRRCCADENCPTGEEKKLKSLTLSAKGEGERRAHG